MPEFVEEANNEKSKNNLSHLCRFEYGDIKDKILTLKNYNIVILSAVGHLWGTFSNTLYNLKKCVKKNGFVIIDDGYTVNGSSNEHLYITRNDALQQITQNNFEVLNEIVLSDEEVKNTNKYNTSLITGRAEILKKKFPDKAKLFDDYIAHQQRETEIFGTKIKCVVWVLKNK
jgi:hypothetical protein